MPVTRPSRSSGSRTLIPVTADPRLEGVETTCFGQRADLSERQASLKQRTCGVERGL
jgi:hypothetical protein